MALIETIPVKEDYRRKMAYKLMADATSAEPIQHWAQGLARLGQGAIGGYSMYQADQRDKETEAGNNAALIAALQGGVPASPAAPPEQPTPQRPTAQPPAPVSSVTPSAGAVPAALTGGRPGGPVMPSAKVWGDAEAEAAGLYEPSTPTRTAALSPMVPTPVKIEAIAATPAAPAAPSPTEPQMADAKARLVQMLQSDNPQMRKIGQNMAQALLTQQLQGEKPTDSIREFQYGQKNPAFNQSKIELEAAKAAAVEKAKREGLPQHEAAVEAAKKAASIAATSQAEAKTEIPTAKLKMDTALEGIEKVRNHPGRESFGGAGAAAGLAGFRPGSSAYDFKVMVDQLKGGSFLQAYETLKGGGPIANAEGAKAEAAIARLDRAQTPAAFDEALNDYQSAIKRGFASLETKAGVTQPGPSQGGAVVWERGPDGKPRRKQ
jgi:hypothetical protein